MFKRVLLATMLVFSIVSSVSAQQLVRLWPTSKSGDITANGGEVKLPDTSGMATLGVTVSNTFSGTLAAQCSTDGVNFISTGLSLTPVPSGSDVTSVTGTGSWQASIQVCNAVRVVATAWTSGTATVMVSTTQVPLSSSVSASLGDVTVGDVGITSIAAGDNNIGNVDVASSALPTGAATSAKQDTGNASLASIDGKITAVNTGAVVVSSSALPSGAATSAAQTTGNSALSAIQTAVETIDNAVSGSGVNVSQIGGAAAPMTTTQADDLANTLDGLNTTSFSYIFDGSTWDRWTGAVSVSNLPTTATTSAVAVRCVNAAGNAFESCAGSGGGGAATEVTIETALGDAAVDDTADAVRALFVDSTGAAIDPDTQAKFGSAVTWTAGTTPTGNFGYWCRVSAAAPSATGVADDEVVINWCDSNGRVHITGDSSMTALKVDGSAVTQPVSLASVPSHAVTNAGTFAVQVSSALPAGTNAIGKLAANSGVDIGDVDVISSALPTGASTSANQTTELGHLANLVAYLQPGTLKRYISVGTTEDESQVKATTGVLLSISAWNANQTTDAFLKCTDATAASTTPGTTTVWYSMIVPHGSSGGSGFVQAMLGPGGVNFATALTCYIVTGKADNDTTEVAAGDVSYNLSYR